MRRDEKETARRFAAGEFVDRKSFVCFDGSEVLAGGDMSRRRREVLERDGHRCVVGGELVSFEEMELDHKRKRSRGRDDRAENLQTMCHEHHREKHERADVVTV